VCQRCGIWNNRDQLRFQFDWRGAQLQNLYILVCNHCYDEPQQQLRAITLPADPVPIYYPSPEDFASAESDYRAVAYAPAIDPRTGIPVQSQNLRTTLECLNRTTLPYGAPYDFDSNAIMPLALDNGLPVAYGQPLPVLSVSSVDTLVSVTFSAVHGLQPNDIVSVAGLTNGNGFFSIAVPTATVITYQTAQIVNPQIASNPIVCKANVGLPIGFDSVPLPYGYTPNAATFGTGLELLLETGLGGFELEDGSGIILLEDGTVVYTQLLLESGLGGFELETGTGVIILEDGTVITNNAFQLESSLGYWELESGLGTWGLENG
jgi:hypothetical protein